MSKQARLDAFKEKILNTHSASVTRHTEFHYCLRLNDNTLVDYWPTTMRMYYHESKNTRRGVTVDELAELMRCTDSVVPT